MSAELYPAHFQHGWDFFYLDSCGSGTSDEPLEMNNVLAFSLGISPTLELQKALRCFFPYALSSSIYRIIHHRQIPTRSGPYNKAATTEERRQLLSDLLAEENGKKLRNILETIFLQTFTPQDVSQQLDAAANGGTIQNSMAVTTQEFFRSSLTVFLSHYLLEMNKSYDVDMLFENGPELVVVFLEMIHYLPTPSLKDLRVRSSMLSYPPSAHLDRYPLFPFIKILHTNIMRIQAKIKLENPDIIENEFAMSQLIEQELFEKVPSLKDVTNSKEAYNCFITEFIKSILGFRQLDEKRQSFFENFLNNIVNPRSVVMVFLASARHQIMLEKWYYSLKELSSIPTEVDPPDWQTAYQQGDITFIKYALNVFWVELRALMQSHDKEKRLEVWFMTYQQIYHNFPLHNANKELGEPITTYLDITMAVFLYIRAFWNSRNVIFQGNFISQILEFRTITLTELIDLLNPQKKDKLAKRFVQDLMQYFLPPPIKSKELEQYVLLLNKPYLPFKCREVLLSKLMFDPSTEKDTFGCSVLVGNLVAEVLATFGTNITRYIPTTHKSRTTASECMQSPLADMLYELFCSGLRSFIDPNVPVGTIFTNYDKIEEDLQIATSSFDKIIIHIQIAALREVLLPLFAKVVISHEYMNLQVSNAEFLRKTLALDFEYQIKLIQIIKNNNQRDLKNLLLLHKDTLGLQNWTFLEAMELQSNYTYHHFSWMLDHTTPLGTKFLEFKRKFLEMIQNDISTQTWHNSIRTNATTSQSKGEQRMFLMLAIYYHIYEPAFKFTTEKREQFQDAMYNHVRLDLDLTDEQLNMLVGFALGTRFHVTQTDEDDYLRLILKPVEEKQNRIRHCLVNAASVALALGKDSHLYAHFFQPQMLENTWGTGSTEPHKITRNGVHYDCGCEFNADGKQKRRGRILLTPNSLYVLYFLNYGGFCLSMLTNNSEIYLKGPVLSDWQVVRKYCYAQIADCWTLLHLNLGMDSEEASFFITQCLEQMYQVCISI